MATAIIFGPTGNIGSIAARTAHAAGLKVVLAMRDPTAPIRGLTPAAEAAGNYTRIAADLTKPTSITAAVQTSRATRAFIYVAHGTPDHMKGTAAALKAAGVDVVVLLSSFTIGRDALADVPPSEIIPYAHARVEMALDEVYGPDGYVALRPGGFATNLLRQKAELAKGGEISMFGPGYKFDAITPVDMGGVAGAILARGLPADGQRKVFLYGPQVLTQRRGLEIVGEVLGRKEAVAVSGIPKEEALEGFVAHGVPRAFAEYMVRRLGDDSVPEGEEGRWRVDYEEGVANVEKYTGRPATGFREWVEANLDLFE